MPAWFGNFGVCCWSYFTGDMEDVYWDGFINHVIDSAREARSSAVAITISFKNQAANANQRRRLAAALTEHERDMGYVVGHAFVSDSVMVRSALTAVNWLTKKPYPEEVFGTPHKGLEWLKTILPSTCRTLPGR